MSKMHHETPFGFRRGYIDGRVIFKPGLDAHVAHKKFKRLVPRIVRTDPLREVKNHLKRKHRFFLSTDLESAFDYVTLERLLGAFEWKQINPAFLVRNKELFFHEKGIGGLIQGAPVSPYLFEFYCRFGGLDRDLYEYCDKLGFYYSRYVDDILVSSRNPLGSRISPSIRRIVGKYGFNLNDKKTKRMDVNNQRMTVLGVDIQGKRLEEPHETRQKLFDPGRSDNSHDGVLGRIKHIRRISLGKNKKRKKTGNR